MICDSRNSIISASVLCLLGAGFWRDVRRWTQIKNKNRDALYVWHARRARDVRTRARQETGDKVKWGATEFDVDEQNGTVRVVCLGDLCHDCKELRHITGWDAEGDEWLDKIENDPDFQASVESASDNASYITDEIRDQALRQQHVRSVQNIRMRCRSAFDLYTLDAYCVKFKHRAQTNRKVCICKVPNQEGEFEVLCVVPSDEPRKLFIEHDVGLSMTQGIMPFVVQPGQCYKFYEQERRRLSRDHPMATQQKHAKFYYSNAALMEETRQREEQKAKEERQNSVDGAISGLSDDQKKKLKMLSASDALAAKLPGVRAPGTPGALSRAPGTPAALTTGPAAPSSPRPSWSAGGGRVGAARPGPVGVGGSSRGSVAPSPAKSDHESSRGSASGGGRWPSARLRTVSSAASALSSRSSVAGRQTGGSTRSSKRSEMADGQLIDIDADEIEQRLWDWNQMLLGTFVWTNHNGVTC